MKKILLILSIILVLAAIVAAVWYFFLRSSEGALKLPDFLGGGSLPLDTGLVNGGQDSVTGGGSSTGQNGTDLGALTKKSNIVINEPVLSYWLNSEENKFYYFSEAGQLKDESGAVIIEQAFN